MARRGANQSVSTKFATTLICDALRLLESGQVGRAHDLLRHASILLPDVNDEAKRAAGIWFKAQNRGIAA